MTLNDLRERTKTTCHEARQIPQGIGKPRWHGLNMRQAWEENAKTIVPFLEAGDAAGVIPSPMVRFHLEGEIYYHAKAHGLQSAMMLKLQRI